MLMTLSIENFAIIDAVSIDFQDGMTVLSGETGAGKSIIIDALGILSGGRGSTSFIRQGSNKLSVEGLFVLPLSDDLFALLESYDLLFDTDERSLIIRREIHANGTNVIKINGQLANVSTLKEIGGFLTDIHGQNEHQLLLEPKAHLSLLDQFGDNLHQTLLEEYQNAFQDYQHIRKEWLKQHRDDHTDRQRLSFIEFQSSEIEAAKLVEGEDEELEQLSRRLQNQQQSAQTLEAINQLLTESDTSVLTQLDQVQSLVSSLGQYDSYFEDIQKNLADVTIELEELSRSIAYYQVDDFDSQSIDEVEERLMTLSQLKRKYQMDIPELIVYHEEINEEIYQLTHREHYLEKLSHQLSDAYKKAYDLANELHQARQELSTELTETVMTELADLYMASSQFAIEFETVGMDEAINETLPPDTPEMLLLSSRGYDRIAFYVATNTGEPLKPLVKVASGGELSRLMLALKSVFSRQTLPKTMVFDEIDTGVSGRVAQAIAEKIAMIGRYHQVLCITHLPQVAAIAQTQLLISKSVQDGRTRSGVQNLTHDERINSIAHMISGEETTPASLELAQELLNANRGA